MNSLSLFKRPFAEGITTALLIMDKGIAYNTEVLFGISRIFIKKLLNYLIKKYNYYNTTIKEE